MAGGAIDILIKPDTSKFASQMESGLKGALGSATKFAGLLGVALSGSQIFSSVISAGRDFEKTLNNMQAVSQATAAQMQQVSAKARELGNDTTLTGTSASDAAAAMAELAKGGFDVQQSMAAAKGTLQLAAAAQVDAATAATIQSQALQAFGLQAADAAKVSDILAGAANASSAEMTDVAYALQASGTVAKQFGVSIEDTTTAISLFANAGITGSDAGTLLKTALLALTDQGKPAQQAISQLGLTVYDAQGKFVGLPVLMDQLAAAAKRMTPEQYQAATATLFGSDAMRFAGIAAEQGATGFNKLRSAVTRQGQAAEVAAAQTQGLPGALERLENQVQDTYLQIFDAIKGPLVQTIDGISKGLSQATPAITEALLTIFNTAKTVGSALAPVASTVASVFGTLAPLALQAAKAFAGLPAPLLAAVGALALLKTSPAKTGIAALQTQFASISRAAATFSDALAQARSSQGALDTAVSTSASKQKSALSQVAQAHTAAASQVSTSAKAMSKAGDEQASASKKLAQAGADLSSLDTAVSASAAKRKTTLEAMAYSYASASTKVSASAKTLSAAGDAHVSFARKIAGAGAGSAAAAMTGLKAAGSGLISFLGGPWAIGFAAATAVITGYIQANQRAKAATENTTKALAEVRKAQIDLNQAFAGSAGKLSADQITKAGNYAQLQLTKFLEAGKVQQGFTGTLPDGKIFQEASESASDYVLRMRQVKSGYKELEKAAKTHGIELSQLGTVIAEGGSQYTELLNTLRNSGKAGNYAADELVRTKGSMLTLIEGARRIPPTMAAAEKGIAILADSSSSAADKLQALRAVLQQLGFAPKDADRAMRDLAQTVNDTASKVAAAVDPAQGLGNAMLDLNGKLDINNVNALNVGEAIDTLADSFLNAAAQGGNIDAAYAQVDKALQQMTHSTGLSIEKLRELAAAQGVVPNEVKIAVALRGADQTKQDLTRIWTEVRNIPAGKSVEVSAVSDDAQKKLEALGFTIKQVPGTNNITVTASTDDAKGRLEELSSRMAQLGSQPVNIDALLNTDQLKFNATEAKALLDALAVQNPSPEAQLIIDNLQKNQQISVADLTVLASWSKWPQADLEKRLADTKIADLEKHLAALKSPITITVDASVEMARRKIANLISDLGMPGVSFSASLTPGTAAPKAGMATGGLAGYKLPTTGPGTSITDGFLALTSAGMPIARLDAGEWVINKQSSRRYHRELELINRGLFPKLPGFAAGGGLGISFTTTNPAYTTAMMQLSAELTPFIDELEKAGFQIDAVKQAEENLNNVRKEAPNQAAIIQKAELELRKAHVDLASANLSVKDAEKKLADARKKGKPDEIEKAEIDVEQARIKVADATNDITEKEKDLADARAGASQNALNLITAQTGLTKAQLQAVIEIGNAVTEMVNESVTAIQDYYSGIVDSMKQGQKLEKEVADQRLAIAKAQTAVMQAQHTQLMFDLNLQKSRQQSQKRLIDLQNQLNKALAGQGTTQTRVVGDFDDAMAEYHRTGMFSIRTVTEFTEEGQQRIADLQAEIAAEKQNQQLQELENAYQQQMNALAYQEAIINQQNAVAKLNEKVTELNQTIASFNGLTDPAEVERAAQAATAPGRVAGGLGRAVFGGLGSLLHGDILGAFKNVAGGAGDVIKAGVDLFKNGDTIIKQFKNLGVGGSIKKVFGDIVSVPLDFFGLHGAANWVRNKTNRIEYKQVPAATQVPAAKSSRYFAAGSGSGSVFASVATAGSGKISGQLGNVFAPLKNIDISAAVADVMPDALKNNVGKVFEAILPKAQRFANGIMGPLAGLLGVTQGASTLDYSDLATLEDVERKRAEVMANYNAKLQQILAGGFPSSSGSGSFSGPSFANPGSYAATTAAAQQTHLSTVQDQMISVLNSQLDELRNIAAHVSALDGKTGSGDFATQLARAVTTKTKTTSVSAIDYMNSRL